MYFKLLMFRSRVPGDALRPNSVENLAHRATLRFNRQVGHLLMGHLVSERSYARIRDAFETKPVNVMDFTLDVGPLPFDAAAVASVAEILDRHGVVVLPNLVDPAAAEAARQEADQVTARISAAIGEPAERGDLGTLPWQIDSTASYDKITAPGRPIANIRSRKPGIVNGGVIDIFSVDQAARENGWPALAACCDTLRSDSLDRIIAAVSPRRHSQLHMIRNDSVTATRGLHVDNLYDRYKVFLYLSDVRDIGDGPYAYVPGTHKRMDLLKREARLNSLAGRPVASSFAFEGREVPILGPAGTAIISCQNGVHRGMPQRPGASRTVLVSNYHI